MDNIRQDLKYAVRALIKDKGYTLTAILTLGLVIGANVAIFSVISSVLLQPLPFPDADRLVRIFNSYPNAGVERASNSAPDYFDRRQLDALEDVANYRGSGYSLGIDGVPRRVRGMQVTPSFFPLLRAEATLGRCFLEEESEVGNHRRVILSHSLWLELFSGDHEAIGAELHINGASHTVVGVMPASFFFLDPDVRLWTPQSFTDEQRQQYHNNSWQMLGRLATGSTLEQAKAQIDALNQENLERQPQLKEVLINAGYHTRVLSFQDDLVQDIRKTLYLLWAGVVFVLLIGCVNVANLALVRASVRVRELSMRVVLGAGQARISGQLITESVLLTMASALLGFALGWAGVQALGVLGVDQLPRGAEIGINATVALVTFAAAMVIGLVLGLIPVLYVMRANISSLLREEGRGSTMSRRAQLGRRGLVCVQVATAFMLLIGAGLLFASFREILSIDLGFEPEGVLTASVMLPEVRYPEDADRLAFTRRALDSIGSLPGIEIASLTNTIPFGGSFSDSVILAEGYQMEPEESLISPSRLTVAPGYYEALSIPLHEGRYFDARDTADAPGAIIVDERLARKYWKGRSAIGKRMYQPQSTDDIFAVDENTRWLTVVGVVGEIKLRGMVDVDERHGAYFFPYEQVPSSFIGFVIKTSGEPTQLIEPIRRRLAEIDAELPLYNTMTLSERISESLVTRRSPMLLTAVFAGVALFLAGVGLYGVVAYLVSQRTREIGIRLALGSPRQHLFRMVMGEGVAILVVGLISGMLAIVLLRGLLASHIYGVGVLEPMVLLMVATVLTFVAMAACWLPALRATRINPAIALSDG
jgi:predicted permease